MIEESFAERYDMACRMAAKGLPSGVKVEKAMRAAAFPRVSCRSYVALCAEWQFEAYPRMGSWSGNSVFASARLASLPPAPNSPRSVFHCRTGVEPAWGGQAEQYYSYGAPRTAFPDRPCLLYCN